MIKKIYFGMILAAGMLASACTSEDEKFNIAPEDAAQVTFTVGLQDGIATRAIGDASAINKLVYAVYDVDGNIVNEQQASEDAFDSNLIANVQLTLPKEQNYTVVFWAQNKDCEAFNTSDLTKVTVDYSKMNNSDDSADAFYTAHSFKVVGSETIGVELKRPFAQINLGTTNTDWNNAVAWGVTIKESKVATKAATSINLMTGVVDDYDDVKLSIATIPAETLTVNEVNYNYLSMSYILAGVQKETLDYIEFTLSPEDGEDIKIDQGLTNVPAQRNYRTNIVGRILTGDVDFNITVDPIFSGDNTIDPNRLFAEVENTSDLQAAVDDVKPATAMFLDDVTYSGTITKEILMDLNENAIIANGCIELNENAALTLKNGSYTTNVSSGYIDVRPTSAEGCTIIAENVDFTNTYIKRQNNTTSATNNRVGYISKTYPQVDGDIKIKMHFKNCTFTNAALNFGGSSGRCSDMDVTFENCTFTALTGSSSGLIEIAYYVTGKLVLDGCTFNLTCTSSSACGVSIASSSNTTVKVYAKNNTVNAVAAEKYTYDPEKGETKDHNIYVPYAVNSARFIYFVNEKNGYSKLELDENNTMTGIAKLK